MAENLLLQQHKSAGPFAETATDAPLDSILLQGKYREIFSNDNISMTMSHIASQLGNPVSGLLPGQMDIVAELIKDIEFQVDDTGGTLNEYSSRLDDASMTITKATDFLSADFRQSYNKVSVQIGDRLIEWYFLLSEEEAEVKGDNIQNLQKDPEKPEILYEKSESNKIAEYNKNNTGYVFRWSDGRRMDHGDVETFIKRKKAEQDPAFIMDFPSVQPGESPPTYTIKGLKQPYYAYDTRLSDPLKDNHNLQSSLLQGSAELEQAYDGHIFIGPGSKGESVMKIQQAINLAYKNDVTFTPLKETGIYDAQTKAAVSRYQKDHHLQGGANGIVGKETLEMLDATPAFTYNWEPSAATDPGYIPQATMTYATAGINSLVPRQDPPDIPAAKDLVAFKPPYSTYKELEERADNTVFNGLWTHWSVQHIEDAKGEHLNIDWYPVKVTQLPILDPVSGKRATAEELQEYVRLHLNDFFDQSISEFSAYSDEDKKTWESDEPLNSVMHFDICTGPLLPWLVTFGNPDDLSVITSEYGKDHWIFSTVRSPKDAEHPVSGNRKFGYKPEEDGSNTFYTQGADRATGYTDAFVEEDVFAGGHEKWLAYQKNLTAFINSHQGVATAPEPYSERFGWTEFQEKFKDVK